jgi:hypothetical protein
MMNSDINSSLDGLLNTISSLLDERQIQKEIDIPLDMSKEKYQICGSEPISQMVFNQEIAAFLRHVYLHGRRVSKYLCDDQSLAEAVFLLDNYYQGANSNGYDAALIDALANGRQGLELVICQLAESIKALERKKYIQWVFYGKVNHMNWRSRCRLFAAYQKKNRHLLPEHIVAMDPAQLDELFKDLMLTQVKADNIINQYVSAEINPL